MRVLVYVSPEKALRSGLDFCGTAVVQVPASSLTPEQREELAQHSFASGMPEADFSLTHCLSVDAPTPENVLLILDALIAARREKAEQEKSTRDTAVQKWLAASLDEWIYHGSSSCEVRDYLGGYQRPNDLRLAEKLAEAEKLAAELTREKRALLAAEKAERELKEAAEKAARASALEVLRQWALAHGSELLRARITGGFAWDKLAEQEYARSVIESVQLVYAERSDLPDGYDCMEELERTTPNMTEIQALRNIKAVGTGKPIKAELKWIKYEPKDYDCEKFGRTEIKVTVTAPNGAERDFYFLPPSE